MYSFVRILLLCSHVIASVNAKGTVSSHDGSSIPSIYHIFNAIHSSMRQWGSSLNHNGVSFFIANVPEDTQFYHGTDQKKAVQGMEWLAFEPEHAMMFAWPRGPPPKQPPPGMPREGDHEANQKNSNTRPELDPLSNRSPQNGPSLRQGHYPPPPGPSHPPPKRHIDFKQSGQQPMSSSDQFSRDLPHDEKSNTGYLHTYRTTRPLRLLYIDGMSAAKVRNGTLDSQDFILRNLTGDRPDHPGELDRANDLCQLAKEEWSNKIDGILRMEGGFEIILCSFKDNLRLIEALPVTWQKGADPKLPGLDMFRHYQAIAARFDGIGGGRVVVDYDDFVTGFAYPVNLFAQGGDMPRLNNLSVEDVAMIRKDVSRMILSSSENTKRPGVDWQSIADMIVARYSTPLKYLTTKPSPFDDDVVLTHEYIQKLLEPFLDREPTSLRNQDIKSARHAKRKHQNNHSPQPEHEEEIARCTSQFLPSTPPSTSSHPSLAESVITAVSRAICSTLILSLRESSYTHTQQRLSKLVHDLAWTTWKRCPEPCGLDEVCYIPIFVLGGTKEDHDHPRCKNATAIRNGGSDYFGSLPGHGTPVPPPSVL